MTGRARIVCAAVALGLLGAAPGAAANSGPPSNLVPADRIDVPAGEQATLFKGKDVKVVGDCIDNGGDDLTADTLLHARRDDLRAFNSYFPDDADLDFDKADTPLDIFGDDATGTSEDYDAEDYDQDFYVENAAGDVSEGQVTSGVHVRDGDGCTFSGLFVDSNSAAPVRTAPRVEVAVGETATIYKDKNFKVSGECINNGAGNFTASPILEARRNNLAFHASETDAEDTDFDEGDPPVALVSATYVASGTTPEFAARDYYQEFWGESPGGRPLDGRVAMGVHLGGADCTFSGIFTGPKSGKGLSVLKQKAVDAGDQATLFKNKSFKVSAKCADNGAGDVTARSFVGARKPNMLMWVGEEAVVDSDLDPSDGKLDIAPSYYGSGTAPDYSAYDYYQEFLGEGKGGEILNGRVATGVHLGGADCTFSGIFTG
jgi:hypothetical protein